MKKTEFLWILSALLFITFSIYNVANASGKVVKFSTLPIQAQNFYTANFENIKIKKIEYDRGDKKYEMELLDKTTITFNEQGMWTEVNCDDKNVVPSTVIAQLPVLIRNKIQRNYINHLIMEVKRNMKDSKNIRYSIQVVDSNGNMQEVHLN